MVHVLWGYSQMSLFFSFSFAVLMGVISALLGSLAFLNKIHALVEADTWQKIDSLFILIWYCIRGMRPTKFVWNKKRKCWKKILNKVSCSLKSDFAISLDKLFQYYFKTFVRMERDFKCWGKITAATFAVFKINQKEIC